MKRGWNDEVMRFNIPKGKLPCDIIIFYKSFNVIDQEQKLDLCGGIIWGHNIFTS